MRKKLLVILGPTATGKTDLALQLANKFRGELVSADSRQVYRGLDIGTGKYPSQKSKVKKESTTGIEYLGRKQVYHKTSTGYGMSNTMRQKIGTSSKLKAFYAKGIESTQTAFVDMTLSGDLKKGLKVKSVNSQGGVVGYESEDSMKIEGNRRYGREVVGLNEENQEKLKKEIIEIFQKNAQTLLAKDIKIQVTI